MKTIRGRFRAAALMATAASVLAMAAGAKAQNTWPYATTPGRAPVLAVVGDVACQPGVEPAGEKGGENCSGDTAQNLLASQAATSKQIENMKPDAVALVGDEQYQVGQYSDFENSYELYYGGFKFITRPAPGNHEFYVEHGAVGVAGYGYFSYFNGAQHNADGTTMTATIANNPDTGGTFTQPVPNSDGQAGHFEQTGGLGNNVNGGSVGVGDGWYSYNLGSWHLISLNIECETQPGGCSDTGSWFSAELSWLKNDLAANQSACTAAYWHQPVFSGTNGIAVPEGPTAVAFWQLLYQYRADLVLNGHDHLYARYRPLTPSGNSDPINGIREFIVGTGGETLDPIVTTGTSSDPSGNPNFNAQNLEAGSGEFWGVMGLTLNPNGYAWDFESALKDPAQTTGPSSFSDTGVATCHGPVPVNPTQTYLSASCGNGGFVYGGNYHCNVSVGSSAGAATGSITYAFDGGTPVFLPLSTGSAQFSLTTPNAGPHTVVIGYERQGNFAAASSVTESFTVSPATTQVSLSPSNNYPGAGSSLTLTASVTSSSAANPTSGTVTFYANGASIGTGPVDSAGHATLTIPSLAAGNYSFNSQFGGLSPDYAGAGSNYLTIQAH